MSDSISSRRRRADAIVVLGCRVSPAGELSATAERRVRRAAEEFHAGVAPLVVATGDGGWGACTEAEAFARRLEALGVPSAAIVLEPLARNTRENASRSARLLRERGAGCVALVTSDWHLARARASFEACGLAVVPAPAVEPPVSTVRFVRRAVREKMSGWIDACLRPAARS